MTIHAANFPAIRLSLMALLCAALAACGGGSGGDTSSAGSSATATNTSGSTPPAPPAVVTTVMDTFGNPVDVEATPSAGGLDASGNIYLADVNLQQIIKITPAGAASIYIGNTATAAVQYNLGAPGGLTLDPAGNVYVESNGNIVEVTPSGTVSTPWQTDLVYTPTPDAYPDHSIATFPAQFAVDGAGNLYVTVACSGIVRKVTPSGVMTTFASGLGIQTSQFLVGGEDGFVTVCTAGADGIAVDTAGNVYVSDIVNNVILKITPDGSVAALAGAVGVSGVVDGTGSGANFAYPSLLSVDGSGNVYVTDSGMARMITPQGKVTTLVGGTGANTPVVLPNSSAPQEYGEIVVLAFGPSLYVTSNYSTDGWALVRFDNLLP